ncbi:MAG TPA: DUF433 domain-containing protein [Candidatus Acidoferrum sp.]|nr:DUF433 domain-containing protein [Candidatus Acidoferrum sp.]
MQNRKTIDRRDIPRYGIEEAARCLGMPAATLNSWVNGREYPTSSGIKFFAPLIEPAGPGRLSFYNLVEAHILLSTRKKHKVEMPAIRRAIDYVQRTYPSPHPLLTEGFLTDGKDLFVKKIEGANRQEQTINVSSWGQLGLGPILDFYLRRIKRDQKGWPIKLFPIRMTWPGDIEQDPPKVVVIDPAVSSGRPVVNGTGVMAEVIVGRFNTGEGIESIAEDYGLKVAQIEEAIRYAPAA